jgi:hypothetical protein
MVGQFSMIAPVMLFAQLQIAFHVLAGRNCFKPCSFTGYELVKPIEQHPLEIRSGNRPQLERRLGYLFLVHDPAANLRVREQQLQPEFDIRAVRVCQVPISCPIPQHDQLQLNSGPNALFRLPDQLRHSVPNRPCLHEPPRVIRIVPGSPSRFPVAQTTRHQDGKLLMPRLHDDCKVLGHFSPLRGRESRHLTLSLASTHGPRRADERGASEGVSALRCAQSVPDAARFQAIRGKLRNSEVQ